MATMTSAFAGQLRVPFLLKNHGLFASPLRTSRQCHSVKAIPSANLLVENEVLPRLRGLSSATRRGRRAAGTQVAEAEALAAQLEAVSAPPPLLEPRISILDGVWHLIFLISGSKRRSTPNLQSATIRAADNDPSARKVTQTINLEEMRTVNSAAFSVLGVPCKVSVDAKLKAVDSYTLEVKFQTAKFKFGFLPTISFPIRLLNAKGTLRTTYLSERCRIGRGDKGSLFVLVKDP